jgi:intracellular septation protein
MNSNLILFGLLPLLAFVIIDTFLGLKAGLFAAMILALIEAVYSFYEMGRVDPLSVGSFILVLIFGVISLRTRNPIYIKLQPVFLGISFGLIFLVMQAMGKPLLLYLVDEYQGLFPSELKPTLNNSMIRDVLSRFSGFLGFGFLAHSALIAYSAFRMNNWWWLFIRGIGVYVMAALCLVLARLL